MEDSLKSVQTLEVVKDIFGTGGFGEEGWKDLVRSGKLKKVYRKDDGSIHWVSAVHVKVLEQNGFVIDERLGMENDSELELCTLFYEIEYKKNFKVPLEEQRTYQEKMQELVSAIAETDMKTAEKYIIRLQDIIPRFVDTV